MAVHTPPRRRSGIAELLSKRGRLPAREPNDGEPVECSRMYVAPPDRHLTLAGDQIRVTAGPRENSVRPAIDPLFRTAAETYRRRVVGVILSGALDDGVAGLLRVKLRGGAAVVQDPEDALFPGMPTAALQHVKVDYVVPASQIAEVLTDLAHGRNYRQREREMGDDDRDGAQVVAQGQGAWENGSGGAQRATGITCPECGGVLWEVHSDPILQFRCHTSHVYSAESLLDEVCRKPSDRSGRPYDACGSKPATAVV